MIDFAARIRELIDLAAEEGIDLPMPAEEIVRLEAAGYVVDLETGAIDAAGPEFWERRIAATPTAADALHPPTPAPAVRFWTLETASAAGRRIVIATVADDSGETTITITSSTTATIDSPAAALAAIAAALQAASRMMKGDPTP